MGITNTGKIRRNSRRDTAEKRQHARNLRTPKQQLAILDERLGKDTGAKKERERLLALIGKTSKA